MDRLTAALVPDLRIMLRQFRRAPLMVLSCVAVLAVGLGGATAAFSALYAVALRPLPYPNPQQLVAVHSQFPRLQMTRLGVSPLDYLDLAKYKHLFSHVGGFFFLDLSRSGIDHAQKVNAVATTTSLFQTLEVRPALGRYFSPVEERPGGPHVVLLSDAYWRDAFGRDPHVLQKTLRLNGEYYSVIGVMPRSFSFPNDATQMWVPAVFKSEWLGYHGRQNVFLRMYGRLADGVTFDEASKRLDRISREAAVRNRGDYTVDLTGWKYFMVPLSTENNESLQSWTWILFGSVAVLFVIVCVNVGGLLVLRSTQRAFEVAVRRALGAGVLRVARQSILEVLLICALGGIAGLAMAALSMRLLNLSGQFGELHFSTPVFGFGVMLTAASAAFCSAYPFWKAMRSDPAEALNAGGYQRTESHNKQYVRRMLVVVQVAASTALLLIGGLLLHTYVRLLQTPLGFNADRVMTMQISLPPLRYSNDSSRRVFYQSVLDRIRQAPGIRAASACSLLPFGYGENIEPFSVAGRDPGRAQQLATVNNILPDFFNTLRIPLLAGTYFDSDDNPGREPAVIVDQTLARRYFPDQSAIGRHIQMGVKQRFLIVGVVGNIKIDGLDVTELPTLYFNAMQMPRTDMSIVLKSSIADGHIPGLVQGIVAKIDRDQAVYDVATLQSRIDKSIATRRFVVFLLASFAGVGVVITSIGLYGALSYSVFLRGRELGIRSAVGAAPRDLGLLIFKHGLWLIVVGAVLGGSAAVWGSRYLSAELYGVRATDAITWLSVAAILTGVAVLACIAPSWRASHTNAVIMLKHE